MIRIVVSTRHGVPPEPSIAVEFGPTGGTIGRAATNTLVLDDPERTVSRVHAQVLCRDGEFFVIDRGSNPLLVNGRALGAGNETPLAADDRLVIGGFELKVELAADMARTAVGQAAAPSTPVDDPFVDLLAGLAPPSAAPIAPAARAPAAAAADLALFPDPMAPSAPSRGTAAVDPFADLLGPAATPAPAAGLGSLDDFSDLGAAQGGGKSNGIDDLFGGMGGLGGGSDPLALSPLADPMLQPNT
ncbi:MAG: FHA domain-containing protein, partial [Variovorax sp.]